MDFNQFSKQDAIGRIPDENRFKTTAWLIPSLHTRRIHEPSTWRGVLEKSRECRSPVLLSESGQKVVRAIRQLCGPRKTLDSKFPQTQASEYYLQESQAIQESHLWDCEAQNLWYKAKPSCGIKQRLQANKARNARYLSSDLNEGESIYFSKTDESSEETAESTTRKALTPAKRKTQQSPITSFFKGRKVVQTPSEAKKAKSPNAALEKGNRDTETEHQKKSSSAKTCPVKLYTMNQSEREAFQHNLQSADEIACTLVYEGGWSLLRPNPQKTKKQSGDIAEEKITGLVIAFPWSVTAATTNTADSAQHRKSRLTVVEIPLENEEALGKWCRKLVDDIMASSTTRKICYDAQKIVRHLIETQDYDVRKVCLHWRLLDTKLAAWLLNPDHRPQFFAEALTSVQLHFPEGAHEDNMICKDIAMLGPLILKQFNKLKMLSLWDLFINVESPLCSMLAVMETQGISVDSQVLINASNTLKIKIQKVKGEAHKAAGHPFLINSPQQLREVLFEELKLDQQCKKKLARTSIKNQKSTSEAVLLHLQDLHPLPRLVLQYRHLVKLKSTYFDGILSHVSKSVLVTSWDQTAAATGRLTSANPNLQAIPKQVIEVTGIKKQLIVGKPEEVITINPRAAYRSRQGWFFLAADFQSIELRLLSHVSEDPSLLHIFNDKENADVFTTLTSQWLGKSCGEVQFQERERTKRIVYSVIYGVGSEKLGQTLKVTSDEAKGFMDSFLGRFPRIKEFTRRSIDGCRKNGYVTTIFNRRRWLPHINSVDFAQRSQAERQAVNFIVQGSAADICKAAMIQVISSISADASVHARLLLQIHDELLLEVPDDEINTVTASVKSIMESTEKICGGKVKLKVPLPVSISIGKTWGHMDSFSG